MAKTKFLYEEIAGNFQLQIERQTLRLGDKLPSVRALSIQCKISITTAYKAYYELERLGLIESKPQSGYYVKNIPKFKIPTGEHAEIVSSSRLSVDDIIRIIYQDRPEKGVLNFLVARPSAALVPVAKLNKSVMEVLRLDKSGCGNYESLQGNLSLRTQISRYAYAAGSQVSPQDVVTTNGCLDAIVLSLKATTSPGDMVAIEAPTFFALFQVLKSLNLLVIEIPSHPETGIDLKCLKAAIEKEPIKVCLLVTNFNNPTGTCMPDQNKYLLVNMLADKNIPLIEDDIYGELYYAGSRPKTCKSFDKNGMILLCSSFSKILAPGYRVGWCIPGKFKQKILELKLNHTISSNSLTHAAISRFLDTGRYDLYLNRLRKELFRQCLQYQSAINKYFPKNIRFSNPRGGCVLWIELGKGQDAFRIYEQAIKKSIAIAPGHIFTSDGRFSNYIRITFSEPYSEIIDDGLKLLGQIIHSS